MGRYTGETVEEAVASASKKLGVAVDQLEVKTIQQPRHGFLGIGRREAIIEVSIKKAKRKTRIREITVTIKQTNKPRFSSNRRLAISQHQTVKLILLK